MRRALVSFSTLALLLLGCTATPGLPGTVAPLALTPSATLPDATATACPSRTAPRAVPTPQSGPSGVTASSATQGTGGQTGEATPGTGAATISPEEFATTQALFERANKTGPTPITPGRALPGSSQPGTPTGPPANPPSAVETPHLSPNPAPGAMPTPLLPPHPEPSIAATATECP